MHTSLFRRSRARLTLGVVALALGLAACSDGPGNEEDLVKSLTTGDAFSTAEAECIASAVFEEYGEDEDALGLISGTADYEALNADDGVPGFDEFFRRAVSVCANS